MELYIFYIEYKDTTRKIFNKVCKKPRLTKLHKYLIYELNSNDEVQEIGYCQANKYTN
jgi:hypothetical protein